MITQGENGVAIPFTAYNDGIIDLTGATVEVDVKRSDGTTFIKVAEILDAISGKCQFVLSSTDLSIPGSYEYQWIAYFENGSIKSIRKSDFYVHESLRTISSGEVSETVLVPFVRVTEFETVKADVEDLKLNGGGGGSGIIEYNTLAELQSAYPNGLNHPVWIVEENSWYYWEGEITQPSDTMAPGLTITAGGTFTGTKTVSMSVNETADIFYTLDGSAPTTSSTKYTDPLSISATTTLKAFARDAAGNISTVQTVTYTLDTTTPADTTAPNNVTNLQATPAANSVALSWTASSSSDVASYDIYNGSTLIANVTGTSHNVTNLSASTQYTFSVRAKDGANNTASGTSVTTTTLAPADTTAPVLTITPAATFADTQTITMSTNETATIWYTVDGSDPTTSGTRVQYATAVTLTATTTVKAYAVDSANNASAVQTVTYTKETVTPSGYVANGLKVYYNFRDKTSTPATITDDSGSGNNGTLNNYANTATSGIVGTELIGDGAGDYISIPNTAPLVAYPFTVEIYARLQEVTTTTYQNLFETRNGSGSGNGISLGAYNSTHATTPNQIELGGQFGQPTVRHPMNIFDNTYKHIVVVWQQTQQDIYVDGVLVKSATNSTSTSPLGNKTIGLFGNAGSTATSATIKGGSKLFRYYSRALTASEITQNYNEAKQ